MSTAAGDREACAAITLALAFYRAPARHADLLHGLVPLPGAISALLRIASGAKSECAEAGTSPEELHKAALFFIEQVMLRHDANHFRVLGVNQGAGLEQIKEHHRLLMRLFHPDREQSGARDFQAEWSAACATRVNLAYNTLRDADSRSRYITSLNVQPARQTAEVAYSPARPRRMARQPDSFWVLRVVPFVSRHLPQIVLGGTAMLGLLVLAGVYLSNPTASVAETETQLTVPHMKLPVAMPPTENPVVEEAKLQAMQLDASIARFERTELASTTNEATTKEVRQTQPEMTGHTQPAVPPKKLNAMPQAAAAPATVMPTAKLAGSTSYRTATPAAPVLPTAQKTLHASATAAPPAPHEPLPLMATAKPPADIAVPVVVAVSSQPAPVAEEPVVWSPHPILSRLIEVYELGDIQALMALFDDGVQTQAGNWSETRRDYETVFRNTELRDFRIEGMLWNPEGATLKGQGRYRLTHMRKGETTLKTQSGVLRMELTRRGRAVLISGLHYLGGRP